LSIQFSHEPQFEVEGLANITIPVNSQQQTESFRANRGSRPQQNSVAFVRKDRIPLESSIHKKRRSDRGRNADLPAESEPSESWPPPGGTCIAFSLKFE